MSKRNAKAQEFLTSNNAKALCAKFGSKTHNIIASGDDKGAVSLWRLNKERPLQTFNSQGASQNVITEVSAICFSRNENEVFSGTNRGSVSIWDIHSQKSIATLKGHSVAISCIATFPDPTQEHLIMTGSSDSTIKLWDLRQKETTMTFKGHSMPINDIEVTPDGKWLASAAEDSRVKLWDINSGKCFQTFDLHDGPVTCLKFNPYDLTLTSGSNDKTIKYWDLEKFGLIWASRAEANGIQNLIFNHDGKYLFTASQDTLKVWYVDTNDLRLLDNVETTWRGVQDLVITNNSQGEEEYLLGLGISAVSFGLWRCPLKAVNRDSNITPEKFRQMLKQAEAKLKPSTPQSMSLDQPFNEPDRPLSKQKSLQDPSMRPKSNPSYTPNPSQRNEKPPSVFVQQAQNILPPNNFAPMMNPPQNQIPQQQYMQMGVNPAQMGFYPSNNNSYPNPLMQPNGFPIQPNQYANLPPQQMDPRLLNFQGQDYNNISTPLGHDMNLIQQNGSTPTQTSTKRQSVQKEKPSLEKRFSNDRNGFNDPGLMAKLHDNGIMKDETEPQKEEEVLKELTSTIIEVNKADPSQLNMSSFLGGPDNKEKNQNFDTISEISKDHSKFKVFTTQRLRHLELILHYWNSANSRSALNAINMLKPNDSTLIMDLLNMSFNVVGKTGQMSIEAACIFLQKAALLIDSKFDHHVKIGFQYINKIFKQFYEEIVRIKTANVMNMVDLAREERVKKYDKIINEFEVISNKERIKKLATKHKDEVGELASRLLAELEIFLSKVKPSDSGRGGN